MYYVYVLKAKNGKQIYIGYTSDLKKRLREHSLGRTYTTARFLPVDLVYYEAYRSMTDAQNREKQLKQHGNALGHLKRRIAGSLGESAG